MRRSAVVPMVLTAQVALAAPMTGATELAPDVLFARRCGVCHAPGGTGAFMLGRRLGAERAVLADRRDLTAPFVAAVVRQGLGDMPRLTRVELTDEELAVLAAWLARPKEEVSR